ncbi:mersacidin/lichenicidin family type 2 lantibiotic [Sorangium sp. So ce1504]|uniref:mersacidin/lichenicidin family type 2 lantibiotic n=1 Tax=Sorangium sp. So ce1504 TaxID=3133337 RepID=UPI003F5FF7CB
MNQEMIVRAWENPVYRASLAPEILASLPANPAGVSMNDLGEDEVRAAVGVSGALTTHSWNGCSVDC